MISLNLLLGSDHLFSLKMDHVHLMHAFFELFMFMALEFTKNRPEIIPTVCLLGDLHCVVTDYAVFATSSIYCSCFYSNSWYYINIHTNTTNLQPLTIWKNLPGLY